MSESQAIYIVKHSNPLPSRKNGWGHAEWAFVETAVVASFRPESSAHRPRTSLRLLHDEKSISGIYQVHDQYVRSVRTEYFGEVWKDSCVEIFLQPRADSGYFNLEMNAGGAHLCCYIEDPTRVPGGFKKYTKLPPEIGRKISVRSSLPAKIDPEIAEPVGWEICFSIPLDVFEHYTGPLGHLSGQTWRGNFFKCAEEVSHPHWASWAPVDEFNFHLPRCFGTIQFA